VAELDRDTYTTLLYSKAPMVIKQLESILGAKYAPTVRSFAAAWRNKWATGADFRAALEDAQGSTMAWYFNEWVDGTGFPVYTVSWDAVQKGYLYEVTVNLFQENSVATGPIFDMPVEFGIYTPSDTAGPKRFGGRASDAQEIYATTAVDMPTAVVLDPEGKLPLKRVVSALPGDINVDMQVDGLDLLYAGWSYGDRFDDLVAGRGLFIGFTDLNRDGVVDDGDLNQVLANFGKCALTICGQ
jgi:aminopeptidase N